MARFVLLHSPLLGPFSWRAAAAELSRLGHAVETPAWPPLAEVEADDVYGALAQALAGQISAGGEPPLLVAHSGAGALVPALADRLAQGPAGAVFVDAILPHPGRSWFDTAPAPFRDELRAGVNNGMLPAWHEWWPPGALERLVPDEGLRQALTGELAPIPVAYFEAPAPQRDVEIPAAYLRLSGAYDREAAEAERRGWPVRRLALDHLAVLTRPEPVALALQALGAEIATGGS